MIFVLVPALLGLAKWKPVENSRFAYLLPKVLKSWLTCFHHYAGMFRHFAMIVVLLMAARNRSSSFALAILTITILLAFTVRFCTCDLREHSRAVCVQAQELVSLCAFAVLSSKKASRVFVRTATKEKSRCCLSVPKSILISSTVFLALVVGMTYMAAKEVANVPNLPNIEVLEILPNDCVIGKAAIAAAAAAAEGGPKTSQNVGNGFTVAW
jgi:hypothetical protein